MTAPDRRALVERAEQRLKVGEGLSLATDPPKRYFTDEQELIRDLLAALTASVSTAQVQALVDALKEAHSVLEHELLTPRDMWAAHVQKAADIMAEAIEQAEAQLIAEPQTGAEQ